MSEPADPRDKLAQIEELVHLGSWEWIPDANVVRWSDQLYRIFDLSPETFPATLDGYLSRVHAADRERTRSKIMHTLETGEPFDHVERIVRDSGETRWLRSRGVLERVDGKPVRMFGTCQDITDHRLLEQQLLQAQKMESLGRLAGGVAHDFNNLLSVILTFAGMISSDQQLPEQTRTWASQILEAGDKAAGLTRRLLDFSRQRSASMHDVNVDSVCESLETMLDRVLGDDIELELRLGADPWTALADAGQLEQVLMNLSVNARDAMPRGGTLRITTEQRTDDSPPPEETGLPARDWIHLEVSDTGHGMDEQTLSRVFEPFFTTKERGEGTGLGLAIVHGFAKSHGGGAYAASEPGVGTTVHVWLPRNVSVPARKTPEPQPQRFSCPTPGTVLVVEDEEQVRDTLGAILMRAGCDVVLASNMEEGLDAIRARKAEIALMVTDVVMPGGGGRELAERARQLNPELPVLFVSGHPDEDLVVRERLGADVPFLQKPFTGEALLDRIAHVLGEVPGSSTEE